MGGRMLPAVVGPALLVVVLTAGCLDPTIVHPGPSTGTWQQPDAAPWMAYVPNAGFCGPICFAGVFIFEDGKVAWITWGPESDFGQDQNDVTSGTNPTMRAVDEPYRTAVVAALWFLDGAHSDALDVRVYDIVTATLPADDHRRIRSIMAVADNAQAPPGIEAFCTDVGSVHLVVHTQRRWDVHVPGHYGDHVCLEFDGPAGDWPLMDRQGAAIWSWLEQPRWTSTYD